MTPRAAVRCPYCENDDATLMEVTDYGDVYCTVCSRVSRPKGATARIGAPPPVPCPAGPGPLEVGGPGQHGRRRGV